MTPAGELGGAATAEDILLPEARARDTGLLDAQGQPIYRLPGPDRLPPALTTPRCRASEPAPKG